MKRTIWLFPIWCWYAVTAIMVGGLHDTAMSAPKKDFIINIGVLTHSAPQMNRNHWQATAEYLSTAIADHRFDIQPLNVAALQQAVADNTIQFLIADPYSYVELAQLHQIQPVLTLKRLRNGSAYSQTSSVIFCRRDNDPIRGMADLVGKTFMAVTDFSFAGWRIGLDALHQQGVAPGFDFDQTVFGHSHAAVVLAVRDGLVTAGTVAAGTLETMAAQGDIALQSFRILNPAAKQDQDFPFLRSAALYPEWPLAVLPQVDRKLVEQVARHLLALPADSRTARSSQLAGWTPALNYQGVHEISNRIGRQATFTDSLPTSIGVHALIFFAILMGCFGGVFWYHRHQTAKIKLAAPCTGQPRGEAQLSEPACKNPAPDAENTTQKAASAYKCMENLCRTPFFDSELMAIILASPQSRRVLAANGKACNILGRTEDRLIGMLCQDLGLSCSTDTFWKECLTLASGPNEEGPVTVKAHAAPLTVEDNEFILVSFIDITEIGALQKQLDQAIARADAAQTAKGQFLANMNHEIRTPLNGIVSMVELLLQCKMAKEHLEYVAIIQQSAKALVSIVDDVMDYCKIETGRIKIETTITELTAEMANIAHVYSKIAQTKGVGFSCVIDPKLPKWIRCDSIRLRQILDNLLNNAVKFTQNGTIHLHAELTHQLENKVTTKFQIGDSGIGIPNDQLENLFDSFSQGGVTAVQKPGGIGLGLTIAKQLIELMGGEIKVESTPGQGTRFWFCLDFEIAETAHQSSDETQKSSSTLSTPNSNARILLVEDNLVNQKVASKILTKAGYEVEMVENGRLALEILAKTPFDLILMDIQMPEMDGLEATRRIRRSDPGVNSNTIPIIAVTANAMNTDRKQCLECGMNDYVTKPIDAAKLLEAIASLLPANQNLSNRNDDVAIPSRLPSSSAPIDMAKASDRGLGDIEFVRSLIKEFICQSPANFQKIRAANERGDVETIKQIAHSIKGAAASLDAAGLVSAALALELLPHRPSTDDLNQLIGTLEHEFQRLELFLNQEGYRCAAND